jgi:hypothetical protein
MPSTEPAGAQTPSASGRCLRTQLFPSSISGHSARESKEIKVSSARGRRLFILFQPMPSRDLPRDPRSPIRRHLSGISSLGLLLGHLVRSPNPLSTTFLRPFLCDSSSFGVRLLCGFFGKSTFKISHIALFAYPKSLLRQFLKFFHETLQYGRERHFRGGYLKAEDRFHSENLEYSISRSPAYRCLSNPVSH